METRTVVEPTARRVPSDCLRPDDREKLDRVRSEIQKNLGDPEMAVLAMEILLRQSDGYVEEIIEFAKNHACTKKLAVTLAWEETLDPIETAGNLNDDLQRNRVARMVFENDRQGLLDYLAELEQRDRDRSA